MRSTPSSSSVIETMLANLGRHGFEVEGIALNPAMTARPTGYITTLSFGEHVEGEGANSIAVVEVKVDLRGDVNTGQLRRWRIARTYPISSSHVGSVRLAATLTLDGDVSADFVQREAKATLSMMIALISDVGAEVSRLRPPRRSIMPQRPIVYVKTKAAGEIAIGRSGLARHRNGLQVATPEARLMCSAICDYLLNSIVPGFVAAAGTQYTPSHTVIPSERMSVVELGKEGAVL
jgi:hypothetical protein